MIWLLAMAFAGWGLICFVLGIFTGHKHEYQIVSKEEYDTFIRRDRR
jgi:hypothetical protein